MQSLRNPLVTVAAGMIIIGGIHFAAPVVNLILLSFLLAMSVTLFMEWAIRKGARPGVAVTVTVLGVVFGGMELSAAIVLSLVIWNWRWDRWERFSGCLCPWCCGECTRNMPKRSKPAQPNSKISGQAGR